VRAYHSRVNRAKLHTSPSKEAHTVEFKNVRVQDRTSFLPALLQALLRH
jgi:hypothetical protein